MQNFFRHIKDVGTLQCNRERDWVETKKGTAYIHGDMVQLHGWIDCNLSYIERVDDFTFKTGKVVRLASDLGPTRLESDFFIVKCEGRDKTIWKNLMASTHRNEELVEKLQHIRPPEGTVVIY